MRHSYFHFGAMAKILSKTMVYLCRSFGGICINHFQSSCVQSPTQNANNCFFAQLKTDYSDSRTPKGCYAQMLLHGVLTRMWQKEQHRIWIIKYRTSGRLLFRHFSSLGHSHFYIEKSISHGRNNRINSLNSNYEITKCQTILILSSRVNQSIFCSNRIRWRDWFVCAWK